MCESSSNIGAFSMTDTDLHMDLGMNELAQSPPQQQEDAGCREEIDQLAQLQQEDNVIIRDGMKVLIKMPMRPIKLVTVESGKDIDLGKFGQVAADSLIGMPFDIQYEILGKDKIRQISDPEVIEIGNNPVISTLAIDHTAIAIVKQFLLGSLLIISSLLFLLSARK